MDVNTLPDEDLAVFVRTHSKASYETLIKRYEKDVFTYINGLVGNDLTANMLTQETFLKIYIRLNDFNASSKFSSFVYKIATLVSFHFLKKKGKARELGVKESLEDEFELAGDIADEFRDPKFVQNVKKFVHKLPILYRAPFLLHFLVGQSYEQISEILLLPVSTIINRMERGVVLIERYAKN